MFLSFVGTASATTGSVDGSGEADFTVIQNAINNASAGDTILVYSGVQYEHVVVTKSVTLKGIGHPVVDAMGNGSAITLNADGITLEGFDACSWGDVGIKVISCTNNITDNNVSRNGNGIDLSYSCNNSVADNKIVLNNIIKSNKTFLSYKSTNIWNSTDEITYIYNGNTYTNNLDNYWDDHEEKNPDAVEIDTAGISDTPYNIDMDKDIYPLMERIENYFLNFFKDNSFPHSHS